MRKTIHSRENEILCAILRDVRVKRGVSQAELAESVGATQSFISKCERGERRVDLVELHSFCRALGIRLEEVARRFEKAIRRHG